MTDEVAAAIDEIRAASPDVPVAVREDGEGGAYVIIDDLQLGPPYAQTTTWLGFRLTFKYPYSDVYPLFIRGDLSRADARALGEAMTSCTFEGRAAIQISRRSNR